MKKAGIMSKDWFWCSLIGVVITVIVSGVAYWQFQFRKRLSENKMPVSLSDELVVEPHPQIKFPQGNQVSTKEKFDTLEFEWLLRHARATYQTTGGEKSKILTEAQLNEFIRNVCWWLHLRMDEAESAKLKTQARQLWEENCTNPVIVYLCAQVLWNELKGRVESRLITAVERLEEQKDAKVFMSLAKMHLSWVKKSIGQETDKIQTLLQEGAILMVDASLEQAFRAEEIPILYRRLVRYFEGEDRELELWASINTRLSQMPGIDPWLGLMVQGKKEIGWAWKARGGGWANDVTSEGWAGFAQHLEAACEALTQAWKMKPDRPEAAALMITVTMGDHGNPGDTVEMWFNRAVTAQVDYITAYDSLLWALWPRWGGSYREMFQFGVSCLESNRTQEGIPLVFLRTLQDIAADNSKEDWHTVFRIPVVHEQLRRMYQMQSDDPTRQWDRKRIEIQRGLAEMWCGDYAQAKMILDNTDHTFDLTTKVWGYPTARKGQTWGAIEAELILYTGPDRNELERAEQMAEDRHGEARALYTRLMAAYQPKPALRNYLRDRAAMEWLAELGTDYNRYNPPIFEAVHHHKLEVVHFLLQNEADPNQAEPYYHTAPIQTAIRNNDLEAIKLLVNYHADLQVSDDGGWIPLGMVISFGNIQLFDYFISAGADPNQGFLDNQITPLSYALGIKQAYFARKLIPMGVDLEKPTINGSRPIHYAVRSDLLEMVQLLIDRKVEINAKDNEGIQPIHSAAKTGSLPVIQALIAAGADPAAKQNDGKTPLDLARERQDQQIVQYFNRMSGNTAAITLQAEKLMDGN